MKERVGEMSSIDNWYHGIELKEGEIWNHPVWAKWNKIEEEEAYFHTMELDFEEGIFECRDSKCGSKKTISFQKQTRSADEGSTTFVKCVVCKKMWKHNT